MNILGQFPYLEVECLNKKWQPSTLPSCVKRSCGLDVPSPWPVSKWLSLSELSDLI